MGTTIPFCQCTGALLSIHAMRHTQVTQRIPWWLRDFSISGRISSIPAVLSGLGALIAACTFFVEMSLVSSRSGSLGVPCRSEVGLYSSAKYSFHQLRMSFSQDSRSPEAFLIEQIIGHAPFRRQQMVCQNILSVC